MRILSLLLSLLLCSLSGYGQVRQISASTAQAAGGSGRSYRPCGPIKIDLTVVGTTAVTTEETLFTYSLPANLLDADYQYLRISAYGLFAANTNGKNVKMYVAGTTAANLSNASGAGPSWTLETVIYRTGASSIKGQTKQFPGTAASAPSNLQFANAGFDTTAAQTLTIKATNSVANANDVQLYGVSVEFCPYTTGGD